MFPDMRLVGSGLHYLNFYVVPAARYGDCLGAWGVGRVCVNVKHYELSVAACS